MSAALSAAEAQAEGLPPEGPPRAGPRPLSAQEAQAEGLPVDGPGGSTYDPSDPGKGIRDMTRAGIRGALDMVPFSHKFIAAVQGEPVANVDKRYADELDANPIPFRTGQVGAALGLPGPTGIKGMAALGAAQMAGDARGGFRDTLEQAGLGTLLGIGLGAGGKLLAKPAAKALPWLQRLEEKLAGRVGSLSAKSEQELASSARSTYGSTVQQGQRALENLEGLVGRTGDQATDAASTALLNGPEGQALAKQVAEHTQAKVPGLFNQIENAKTLADTTAQDAAAAYAKGQTPEVAAQRLKDRALAQVRRYLVTGAGGAALGYFTGDEGNKASRAMEYGVMGAAANRSLRAVAGLATSPEAKRLLGRAAVSITQKLAGLATSQPQLVGKFAAPLARAAERGDDAVAATHFILAQDPSYQDLIHKAAENDQ